MYDLTIAISKSLYDEHKALEIVLMEDDHI
jgi:hypothetical protein